MLPVRGRIGRGRHEHEPGVLTRNGLGPLFRIFEHRGDGRNSKHAFPGRAAEALGIEGGPLQAEHATSPRGGHGIPQKIVIEELTAAGLQVEKIANDWPSNDYCVLFTKK